MTRITVIGGTGYAGAAIVREAASRGLAVTSFSQNPPAADAHVGEVDYQFGSMLDETQRARALEDADILVTALSPRGALRGKMVEVERDLAIRAGRAGTRLLAVGGFSLLSREPGGPRIVETDELPEAFAEEALELNAVLDALIATPEAVKWVFLSPGQYFGAHMPGNSLGRYRVGADVAFYDDEGISTISGADYARAVVDEALNPKHRRQHISVAY